MNCVAQSNAYAIIITSRQSFKWLLLQTHFVKSPLTIFARIWTINFGVSIVNGHMQHQALSINIAANHLSLFGGSLDIIELWKHARNCASYTEQCPWETNCCSAKIFPVFYGIGGSLSCSHEFVTRQGREAHRSPPASAEVKKIGIYTSISIPPHAFMA